MEVQKQVYLYIFKKCTGAFPKPNGQVHDAICWISKTVYATKWKHFVRVV